MIPEDYSKLINKLFEKTSRNEVNWASTSNNKEFLVSFKNFSLSIAQYAEEGE